MTTIRVSDTIKELLNRLKQEDETYDDLLSRLDRESDTMNPGVWDDRRDGTLDRVRVGRRRRGFRC